MKFKNREDYLNQRKSIMDEAQTLINDGKIDESNAKLDEVKELDNEWEKFAKAQANLNALTNPSFDNIANAVGKPAPQVADFGKNDRPTDDKYNTVEYRKSFMNFVLHGAPLVNTAAQTTTGDVAAVIPTTVINKIVEKMSTAGTIYNMVTKTSYKGGVTVPTSSAKPTASWVAERGTADDQEKTTGSITFAYRKLICRVAVSLETSIVSMDVFESTLAQNITEAMLKKIDAAIISGTGSTDNMPKGILAETPVTGQTIEIAKDGSPTYANLVAMEAALPSEYENGSVWCMRKATFYNKVVALVDDNNQPVARTNIGMNGRPEPTILGRRVVFSDDVAAYANNTKPMFIFNFADYMLNTNMQLTVRKYIDEDTDDVITKALMLVDGKAIDINSLVVMSVKNS